MAPVSSATLSNRDKRRAENKLDVKHLLEEVWKFDLDETFHKVLSIEANNGTKFVIDMSKENLKKLKWQEDNGDLAKFMANEVGKIHSLKTASLI